MVAGLLSESTSGDVQSAFLNGRNSYVMWGRFPRGMRRFTADRVEIVQKILGNLYGTTTAGKEWFEIFRKVMKWIGFNQVRGVQCWFVLSRGRNVMWVLVHVDDMAATGNNYVMGESIFGEMKGRFELKGPEPLISFTGMGVIERGDRLFIEGRAYVRDMLVKYGYGDKETGKLHTEMQVKVPMLKDTFDEESPRLENAVTCQAPLGELMYVALVFHDHIKTAVSRAARHMHDPRQQNMVWIDQIMRNLIYTFDYGVVCKRDPKFLVDPVVGVTSLSQDLIETWADTSWIVPKSITGGLVFGFNMVILTISCLQSVPANSTQYSEYIGFGTMARYTMLARQVTCDVFGITKYQLDPTMMYGDHLGCLRMVAEKMESSKLKHVDFACHDVRHFKEDKQIGVAEVDSLNNPADMMTKALKAGDQLRHMLRFMCLIPRQ